MRGKSYLASHIILEANGFPRPAPPANQALHLPTCFGGCSNPKHLRWGTIKENMQDKIVAGTAIRLPGTFVGVKSTLTEQDVRDIRNSTLPLSDLAELYEISTRSIWDIKNRRSWVWVSDEPPSD